MLHQDFSRHVQQLRLVLKNVLDSERTDENGLSVVNDECWSVILEEKVARSKHKACLSWETELCEEETKLLETVVAAERELRRVQRQLLRQQVTVLHSYASVIGNLRQLKEKRQAGPPSQQTDEQQEASVAVQPQMPQLDVARQEALEEVPARNKPSFCSKELPVGSTVKDGSLKLGTLKHSKGSLDGSLIVVSPSKFRHGQLKNGIPVPDFEADMSSSFTVQNHRELSCRKAPRLPDLAASDCYNAVHLVGPTPKDARPFRQLPPSSPQLRLNDSRLNQLKKPELPPLLATDLYDASKLFGQKMSAQTFSSNGAFERPPSSQKLPKDLAAYRAETGSNADVNETFTVAKTFQKSSDDVRRPGFTISYFSLKDYDNLDVNIKKLLTREQLNAGVDKLNRLVLASEKGQLSRKDLERALDWSSDVRQRLLFAHALTDSGRLHRLKPSKSDQSLFASR